MRTVDRLTLSAKFLTPLINLKPPITIYGNHYEGTFLGDVHKAEYREWGGPYILLVFNEGLPTILSDYLSTHELLHEKYEPIKGHTTFVFRVSKSDIDGVITPFLDGKFSKVSRDYVTKHFPLDSKLSGQRLVFDKSRLHKERWEELLGVSLPEDAEVWSKPKKTKEIYGYLKMTDYSSIPPLNEVHSTDDFISDKDLLTAMS